MPLVDAVLGCAPVFERQFHATECDANSTYFSAIAPEDDATGEQRAAARSFVAGAGVGGPLRYALEMIWQVGHDDEDDPREVSAHKPQLELKLRSELDSCGCHFNKTSILISLLSVV